MRGTRMRLHVRSQTARHSRSPGPGRGRPANGREAGPAIAAAAAGTTPPDSAGDLPPRFRGLLHLIAFVAATPVGLIVVLNTRPGSARESAIAFAASVTALLGVSSLFHRAAGSRARKRWSGRSTTR